MNDRTTYIPRYLDEPERFLFWTLDEALIFMVPLFVGITSNFLGTGFLIGAIAATGYGKLKSLIGKHFLPGVMYWYLPLCLTRFKATPPSYIREYVG